MSKPLVRRVTRADIAREAGTSVAVVSYVINNGPRPVAPATRERVLAAIKKTGYRPNGIARALASGTTRTYGLVVPNIANPFISSMAHALQQEAFADGRVLLLGDAGDDRVRERELVNNLLHRQVDGLIYTSVDRHPWIEMIQASGTPLVMLDRVAPELQVSAIQVNEQRAAWQATRHLIEHGYREIAIICGPLEMLNTQDRISGWRQALEEAGLTPDPARIFATDYTRQGGYDAAQRMLAGALPRALFATNEQQAFGCLRALAGHGLSVPNDLALVCFNGTVESAFNVPSLTAVRQPVISMARKAIEMLKQWDGEPERCEFDFELEIGESCGCRPVAHARKSN
ncbi:LacI family DNA-binding transcriptional regulator [Pluralibacter gergoviae]|uniref:LacI family DNA-binding transcriptional regulator n=1 Tax=Pluralibacter gergoviae TaxID=61647 RepID=UPI000A3BD3C5|nr:LacI family DNA-binding transcriptional regulator [Pluralibacter gergoviae]EKT9642586.1 LacI family DNA-binding transcriptional regulator [Pluralibacter gergoviae]EKV3544851.1 LacI family DNA-binding transcriptional regulator [Pluralibacter gergoviae]EKV9897392.1 LacI family DNA-binding transcriptional regulator [Pluralibacter gergoviae]EKV9931279.1 LacI family DNA-binding transcriptional regulator [Pluralibacter gergoviae]EKW9975504.1 LacI family DNA-binding transcriptional regulator [Plur